MRVPGVFSTSFEPDVDPVGTAVLVPGTGYPPMAPLLFFAGMAALEHGWRVVHHWWDPPDVSGHEMNEWVREQVEGALPTSGRALVVGKSLGTRAAPVAAERGLPAVWLTPLFGKVLVDAYAANPAPQLLIGGTEDDLWDSSVAHDLASETRTIVEIPDVDHAMLRQGDILRGVEAHVEVTRAVDEWLPALD